MAEDQNSHKEVLDKLINKKGSFSYNDLRKIKEIPHRELGDFFEFPRCSSLDRNYFRTKYFESQASFWKVLENSALNLTKQMRKPRQKTKRRRDRSLQPNPMPDFHELNERFRFVEDIASVTPEQIHMMHEEGIRRGISLVEDERPLFLRDYDFELTKDDFFGDEPYIPHGFFQDHEIDNAQDVRPELLPIVQPSRATGPGETIIQDTDNVILGGEQFNPRFSSTPLVANVRQDFGKSGLNRISESEELQQGRSHEQVVLPDLENAQRLSHYTPIVRPTGAYPKTSKSNAVLFKVDNLQTEQEQLELVVHQQPELVVHQQPELVHQQPELVVHQQPKLVVHQQPEPAEQLPLEQPDFAQLRAEAIRRHIVNQPKPRRPIPRRRRRPRPLELWSFQVVEPKRVTKQRLNAFLYPDIPYLYPHIHHRPTVEQQFGILPNAVEPIVPEEASAISIPQAQNSGSNVQQSISSIPGLGSMSRDLPVIPESIHEEIIPPIAPAIVPEFIPEVVGNMPEIVQHPQEQSKQPAQIKREPSEEEQKRAIRIARFLYGQDRDRVSMMDFKEEFPTRLEIVGVFKTLLNFNGILWNLVKIGNTTKFEIHKLSDEKRRKFCKSHKCSKK